ncbi:uncharacterized protein LOC119725179 [Patiria miniata]|uniref:G-protein coupled receptors family 2 profile 2 domain-containing protein n=1 Tax=Patiria miniata TaxID=46514 RepID=A0A913ZKZ0_PATMI|nr:uncharacterized protein LOC119725179 [Patiria miniata]
MLSLCPKVTDASHTNRIVHQNCETRTNDNPSTRIPVTDTNGVTFRNVYCALCHGRPTNKLVPWTLNATCEKSVINRLQNTSRATYQRIVWNNCSHSFQLPSVLSSNAVTRRPCLPSLLRDCGSDGSMSTHIAEACRSFTAVVCSKQSHLLYRNPACYAMCELSDGRYTLTCPSKSSFIFEQYAVAMPHSTVVSRFPNIFNRREEPDRGEGPVLTPLSIIFDFGPDNSDGQEVVCEDGDLYDSTTQECLSPSCRQGFIFMASEGKCEPINSLIVDTTSERFHCLDRHYQMRSNFSLQVTVETANMTRRNISTSQNESSVRIIERSIQDSLRVMYEERQDVTAGLYFTTPHLNASATVFKITFQKREGNERLTFNDTGNDDADFWRSLVDSMVEDIEKWLLASSDTGGRSCGIETVQIVQQCGGDVMTDFSQIENCQETLWLPLDEDATTTTTDNQTILIFDETTGSWFNVSSYSLRIGFQQEGTHPNRSSTEIGLCRESALTFTCPTVELQESQFSPVEDIDISDSHPNGSLVYIETGEVLSPDEFVRMNEGRIKVCSSLLANGTGQSPFFNFTHAQAILSTVGLCISVFAGTITLITYVTFPSLHSRTRKAIMGMVASLIAAQLLLLTSGRAAANKEACTAVAVAGHFLWMASLTWTNVLAFLLWHTFAASKPAPSGGQVPFMSKTSLLGIAYALGIPLAVVIPCLVIHFCSCTEIGVIYSTSRACWVTSGLVNLVAFGVPMALFLVINIVLFARTVWAIRSSHRRSEKQLHKKREKKLRRTRRELMIYIRIASLMGFTWVFGFVSSAFPKVQALSYIFILLNSLQGLFIFLSFTFNSQVKVMWQKKLSPVGSSIWSKTSLATSKLSKSSVTASSVSAGVAASESMEMSSSPACEVSTNHSDDGHKGQSKQAGRLKSSLSGFWAKKHGHEGHQSEDYEDKTKYQDGPVDVDECNNLQMKAAKLKARPSGIWVRHLPPSRQDPKSKVAEPKNRYGDGITRMSDIETAKGIPHGKPLPPKHPNPQQSTDVETLRGILNRGISEDLDMKAPSRPKPLPPIPPSKPQQQPEVLPGTNMMVPHVSCQGVAASRENNRCRSEGPFCGKPLPPTPPSKPQHQAEDLQGSKMVVPQNKCSGMVASCEDVSGPSGEGPSCGKPQPPVPRPKPQHQVSSPDLSASQKDDQDIFGIEVLSPGKPLPPPKPQNQIKDLSGPGDNVEVSQVSSLVMATSQGDTQDILESEGPSCGKPVPPRPKLKKTGHPVGLENLCNTPPGLASQDIQDQDLSEDHPPRKPTLPPKPTLG